MLLLAYVIGPCLWEINKNCEVNNLGKTSNKINENKIQGIISVNMYCNLVLMYSKILSSWFSIY